MAFVCGCLVLGERRVCCLLGNCGGCYVEGMCWFPSEDVKAMWCLELCKSGGGEVSRERLR
jgi:hypothetical protein